MRIVRKKFKAWLEAKKPRAKVGMPCKGHACPLANYLSETHGEFVRVGCLYATTYEEAKEEIIRKRTKLPLWADKFVYSVDGLSDERKYITAKKALSILKGIK